jgi:ABC-type glycerol-3-phosphate transport system permease component
VSRAEKILKAYIFVWAGLGILTVWLNQWIISLGFGFISCVIGAMAATAQVDLKTQSERNGSNTAVALMVFGCVFSLIELIDKFMLPYFIR